MQTRFIILLIITFVLTYILLTYRFKVTVEAAIPCILKTQGDADCKKNPPNGTKDITTVDYEIWRKEYFAKCSETNLSVCGDDDDDDGSAMDANFNYIGSSNQPSDSAVTMTDFEIWRKGYFQTIPNSTPTPSTTTQIWKPLSDKPIHWHWQLSENFSYPRDVVPGVTVYDIDGEYTSAETVAQLHAMSPDIKVICYIDVGVFEDYRSDAHKFPDSVKGNADEGWDGSWWLDVRQTQILLPIMEDRIRDWCKAKGFDAVEPDESEVSNNNSGFPITNAENVAYSKAIADLVHKYGMSVGLKGNNAEAASYAPFSDWSLSEQCFEYSECNNLYTNFAAQGKAVFIIEYNANPDCSFANQHHLNAARRDLDLVGPTSNSYKYLPCVPDSQNNW